MLAQRVIRLLLAGVDPAKILCITFTKAAAANMANRVFDTLADWTTLDDAALDDAIARAIEPQARRRAPRAARRLFARALETPGGLKVQTIHAFCTRLLHQFPFEANVAARFSVLDDADATQLLEQLTLDVLLEGAAAPDSALGRALADRHRRGRRPDLPRRRRARRSASATRSTHGSTARRRRRGDRRICRRALGVDPADDTAKHRSRIFFRTR